MYTKRLQSTSVVFFTIALFFNSCNYAEKQQQYKLEMAHIDSIERVRRDSIAQKEKERELARIAHEDSLAIIAWGDAKFGMTAKEVLRTKSFGRKDNHINKYPTSTNKYSYSISMDYDKECRVQNALELYNRPLITIYFGTENEANKIHISGGSSRWQNFSNLVDDMNKYIIQFTSKYGEPETLYQLDKLDYRDLDRLGVDRGIIIAKWIIGNEAGKNGIKNIEILAFKSSITYYDFTIKIVNTAFPRQKEKTQQEIQAEKEKKQKAKETIENAF